MLSRKREAIRKPLVIALDEYIILKRPSENLYPSYHSSHLTHGSVAKHVSAVTVLLRVIEVDGLE